MTRKVYSISTQFLFAMLAVNIIAICILGTTLIYGRYHQFNLHTIKDSREKFIANQKAMIKREVERAVEDIFFLALRSSRGES